MHAMDMSTSRLKNTYAKVSDQVLRSIAPTAKDTEMNARFCSLVQTAGIMQQPMLLEFNAPQERSLLDR
jgi:hypothetical protein